MLALHLSDECRHASSMTFDYMVLTSRALILHDQKKVVPNLSGICRHQPANHLENVRVHAALFGSTALQGLAITLRETTYRQFCLFVTKYKVCY